jgi:hypothetical protein
MQKASGFLSGVGIYKLGGRWVRYIAEERDYLKKKCFSFNLHFIIKIFWLVPIFIESPTQF